MNDFASSKRIAAIVILAGAGVLIVSIMFGQAFVATASHQESTQTAQTGNETDSPSWLFKVNRKYMDYENGVFKVRAGVGNEIAPLTWFFPQNAEIKVGETVVWYNPTTVGEPHTVSFVNEPTSFAPIEAPFIVSNSTDIVAADPAMNAEPLLIPGPNGTKLAILNNARSTLPVTIIDGNAQYLPLNTNYTMTGNEDYVNSGWIWPVGQTPQGLPQIETFGVKFDAPGAYDYVCLIHPWMAGTVTVS
jgi:plastocyanin